MNAPTDRSTFLGGSEAAAILGLSPWATPLVIYQRKRGEVPEHEIDPWHAKILKRGKRMEPVVIDMLIDELGIEVTKRSTPEKQNRYADKKHKFLASEIDFEWRVRAEDAERWGLDASLIGTIQNGEVKTVHPFGAAKYGEEGTDEIPIEYGVQAMHGLMVTGRALTLFAVLVGSDNLLTYTVRRDDETVEQMRAKEVAFWRENVLKGVPPEPQDLFDVYRLFNRKRATKIEAKPETADLVRQLKVAGDEQRVAEEKSEELKFQIGRFMLGDEAIGRKVKNKAGALGKVEALPGAPAGTHVLTMGGQELLTVSLQSRDSIDMTLLRSKHPDVARECAKQSEFFVFRPKRTKS